MEHRKIIEFGKSSHVVSLPKKWLEQQKLSKGDILHIDENGSKLIIHSTDLSAKPKKRTICMDVTDMSLKEIKIRLVSAYVQNYNEITFTSKELKSKSKLIRDMVHDMMALEVVEETSTHILAKDFLNMEELSPKSLVKKLDGLVREMLIDSKNTFKEDKYENISERDGDVNRMSYLLSRTLRFLIMNPMSVRRRNLSHEELMIIANLSKHLEVIADQTKRIAKLMSRLKLNKSEKSEFEKIYSQIEHYYIKAMIIFYECDVDGAVQSIIDAGDLLKRCSDFYRANWDVNWMAVVLEEMKTIVGTTRAILKDVCDVRMPE